MGENPIESDNLPTYSAGPGGGPFPFAERQTVLGDPIRLQVWLRNSLLGPAWAALCGALASGGLTLSTEPILRTATLLFLVDVVWGGLWSALAATNWATQLQQWRSWRRGQPVRFLPYTSSAGSAGRLANTLGNLRCWWKEASGPNLGPTLAGIGLLLPLAVIISSLLGARPLVATLAAITLLQFVFFWTNGDARPVPGPQAVFEIALPWIAGHGLFEPLTPSSTALAVAFTLSYNGGLRVSGTAAGLSRWNLGQLLVVIVLVASRQPLAAGIVGLLFFGQAIIQPGLFDIETEQVDPSRGIRFIRLAQYWLMACMLVAAWGIRTAQLASG